MIIHQGDLVTINTDTCTLHGIATSRRVKNGIILIGVYTPPSSANFGCYAGWSGTEFFLPSQIIVNSDASYPPGRKVLWESQ